MAGAAPTHEEVLLHVVLLVGAVVAERARERLLARVDAQVPLEVVFLVSTSESFAAEVTSSHGVLLNLARRRHQRHRVGGRMWLVPGHHWALLDLALVLLPRLPTIRASSLPLQSAKISEVTPHRHTHSASSHTTTHQLLPPSGVLITDTPLSRSFMFSCFSLHSFYRL